MAKTDLHTPKLLLTKTVTELRYQLDVGVKIKEALHHNAKEYPESDLYTALVNVPNIRRLWIGWYKTIIRYSVYQEHDTPEFHGQINRIIRSALN